MRTKRIVIDLSSPRLSRKALLVLLMAASAPLAGQVQTTMTAVFPPPVGRHNNLLTTGTGAGNLGVTALGRLPGAAGATGSGAVFIGAPPAGGAPGAAMAVIGKTVLGDSAAALSDSLASSAYSMILAGGSPGVQMQDRNGSANRWALTASGAGGGSPSTLTFWYTGGGGAWTNALSVDENGKLSSGGTSFCLRMPGSYTYHDSTADSTCPATNKMAVAIVNDAGDRIGLLGQPTPLNAGTGSAAGCPSGCHLVCCKFL
jgi:hypothetical protein